MTHPNDETLTSFFDGDLSDGEAAAVRAHVEGCSACSEQLAAVTSARSALAGLVEQEVPVGVIEPVLREAGIMAPTPAPLRRTGPPRIYRLLAAAAVVVVAVGALGVVVEVLRDEPGDMAATSAESAGGPLAVPVEDVQELERTAARKALQLDSGDGDQVAAPEAPSPSAIYQSGDSAFTVGEATLSGAGPSDRVARCLDKADAFADGATFVESYPGTYAQQPALFAVLTEGPPEGGPHDRVVIWVFAKEGCGVLAFTTEYYPSMRPSPPSAFPTP